MARTINFNINWYNGTKTGKYAYIVELFMSLLLSMAYTQWERSTLNLLLLLPILPFASHQFFSYCFLFVVCSHARMSYDPKFDMCGVYICTIHIEHYIYTSILYYFIRAYYRTELRKDVERISNISLPTVVWLRWRSIGGIDDGWERVKCALVSIFCCCRCFSVASQCSSWSSFFAPAYRLFNYCFLHLIPPVYIFDCNIRGRRYFTRHIFALLAWAWAWDIPYMLYVALHARALSNASGENRRRMILYLFLIQFSWVQLNRFKSHNTFSSSLAQHAELSALFCSLFGLPHAFSCYFSHSLQSSIRDSIRWICCTMRGNKINTLTRIFVVVFRAKRRRKCKEIKNNSVSPTVYRMARELNMFKAAATEWKKNCSTIMDIRWVRAVQLMPSLFSS